MSLFLNCEEAHYNSWDGSGRNLLHCPNASAVARFKRAVQMGDITWHAAATDQEAVSAAKVVFGCCRDSDGGLLLPTGILPERRALQRVDGAVG